MTRHPRASSTGRQLAGFTLVELMVALTIGSIIALMIGTAFVSNSSTKRTNARFEEFQTNGRYAVDFLRRELQHAGFRALSVANVQQSGGTGTTDYGCGGNGVVTNLQQPVWGSNDTNPFSASCIPAANYARGDVLVVRRAGLDAIPAATALAANTLYVRSEFLSATVFQGPTRPANVQPPVEDYLLQADIYYVSPWTNSAAENPAVPALQRLTLGPGPALTRQVVASDVENMQIQYGVSTAAGTRFFNANAMAAADWANVVAVRLWLLVRSTDADPDYKNTSTYTLGDQNVTVNDSFQRQVLPLVVQLRK